MHKLIQSIILWTLYGPLSLLPLLPPEPNDSEDIRTDEKNNPYPSRRLLMILFSVHLEVILPGLIALSLYLPLGVKLIIEQVVPIVKALLLKNQLLVKLKEFDYAVTQATVLMLTLF